MKDASYAAGVASNFAREASGRAHQPERGSTPKQENAHAASYHREAAAAHREAAKQTRIKTAEGSAHVKLNLKERLKALVMRFNQPDTPEQAASEEAAELVGYNVIKTLLNQISATHEEALALIEQLVADETESPTETPAQEDAEEEVEEARLEALRTLCMTAMSSYSQICSQVSSLLMPEPEQADAPRYMAGARNNAADQKMIQTVHDHSVNLGASCHAGNVRALAAGGDKSLDDRIQAVNTAIQNKYGGNNSLLPSTAWARQVYDDHCIVSKGDKLFSVPYTVDKSGVVTLGDTVTEVKQEYVAAAAAMAVGDKVTIDKPGHDAHGKTGVIKSTAKGGTVHTIEMDGKVVGAFHQTNLKTARAITQKERDALPESDFAGKGTSFPIKKPADVAAASKAIGRAGADNYDTDTLKANIIKIAKRKGAEFEAQLPEAWKAQPKAAETANITKQTAAAVETAVLKAAEQQPCGCATGGKPMTKDARDEAVKTLIGCKHSGFTAEDQAMLETASDARLESFLVAAEARKNEVEKAKEPKTLSADEFMAQAPQELKTLLARQKRQETERKAELVTALKAAQEEYAESELSAMSLDDLERMARMARIAEKPSYAGRGLPRAAQETDVYANPPDPYAEGIKALRAARAH
jgi:hypothetical protein